jgi:RimJ/RimL family protein N-acetyltransferase
LQSTDVRPFRNSASSPAVQFLHSFLSPGSFVVELGFADYKRDIEPSLKGVPELGWALAPRVHGKGYATDAVRTAVLWGEAHFGSARTVCPINPENLASIRVAEKCGDKEFQRTTHKGHPTTIFAR